MGARIAALLRACLPVPACLPACLGIGHGRLKTLPKPSTVASLPMPICARALHPPHPALRFYNEVATNPEFSNAREAIDYLVGWGGGGWGGGHGPGGGGVVQDTTTAVWLPAAAAAVPVIVHAAAPYLLLPAT